MPTVSEFIEKYNRRYSPEEWEEGVKAYVNHPDFEALFTEQKNRAIEGYTRAGAPRTWLASFELGLSLVSAEDFKNAITDPVAKQRYESGKTKALQKLQKKAYIPVEQANAVIEILRTLNIADVKKRMDANFAVGQHFKRAIYYKLLGDINSSDNELMETITKMQTYGVGNLIDDNGNLTSDGQTVLSILQSHRDIAVQGLLQ